MALNKGKHNVAEIEGERCTVVDTGLTKERAAFLQELLLHNGFQVKCEQEKAKDGSSLETCILGVTDLLFNPVINVYQHRLFRKDGKEVTPAYWNQWTEDPDLPYWQVSH
jgi:hypothetical protein